MVTVNVTEGTVPFSHPNLPAGVKCETWYRIVGTLPGPGTKALPPLITLHGGPGVGHLYLPPTFDRLASSASTISAGGELSTPRAVIYYDQVGAGRSTHLRQTRLDVSVWTVELFVAELDNLIRHLGLTESETPGFDLFGHSWGSILAVSFATADPAEVPSVKGLRRLVAASGPASMPLWQVATRGLLAKMPAEVREAIEKGEKEKNYESEEYEAAILEFYKVHLCRLWPFPDALSEAFGELQKDDTVYMTMNGPSEITVVGSLKSECHWPGAPRKVHASVI